MDKGAIPADPDVKSFSYALVDKEVYFRENIDEDGRLESKADMFTKRTIRPERHITSVDTPSEAPRPEEVRQQLCGIIIWRHFNRTIAIRHFLRYNSLRQEVFP